MNTTRKWFQDVRRPRRTINLLFHFRIRLFSLIIFFCHSTYSEYDFVFLSGAVLCIPVPDPLQSGIYYFVTVLNIVQFKIVSFLCKDFHVHVQVTLIAINQTVKIFRTRGQEINGIIVSKRTGNMELGLLPVVYYERN